MKLLVLFPLSVFLCITLCIYSCQKEVSYEGGQPAQPMCKPCIIEGKGIVILTDGSRTQFDTMTSTQVNCGHGVILKIGLPHPYKVGDTVDVTKNW